MDTLSHWLRSAISGAIAMSLMLIAACVSQDTTPAIAPDKPAALIWTHSQYRPGFFSLTDFATVTRIGDRKIINWEAQKVEQGHYRVEISYTRQILLCGYLGCLETERLKATFDLLAEAGHSYMPFALKRCDLPWVGILDTGNSAREDQTLENSLSWEFWELKRLTTPWQVVAGTAPPANCTQSGQ